MSKNTVSSGVKRRSFLLPFGVFGTLLAAGGLSVISPALAVAALTLPLSYVAYSKVLRPVYNAGFHFYGGRWGTGRLSSSVPSGDYGHLDVSDGKGTGIDIVDALVSKLRDNGLQVSTDWSAAKNILRQLPEKYDSLKRDESNIYGFVFRGTVFINPKKTAPDVPIHEYTHIWAEALRQRNPGRWKVIVELMKKETAIWKEVMDNYPHLDTEDQIADEVLATYSGRKGAARLAEHCVKGDSPQMVFQSLLTALERFWKGVTEYFSGDVIYDNAEDLADRVLSDFLTGFNPNRFIDEDTVTLNDTVPLASVERVISGRPAVSERVTQLLTSLLPDKGRIELPRPFVLDQPVKVGNYDMSARYIIRNSEGEYRFSDGQYTLPLSRLAAHQSDELCEILKDYGRFKAVAVGEDGKVSEDAFIKLLSSHVDASADDTFFQVSVPVHENAVGLFSKKLYESPSNNPVSFGMLYSSRRDAVVVLYDHRHYMDNGTEYRTVLSLPYTSLTADETLRFYDSLQKDLQRRGRLFGASLSERFDMEEEQGVFDVTIDYPWDSRQGELAADNGCIEVDEVVGRATFNDYDETIIYSAMNLCNIRERMEVIDAISDRISDSSARSFTDEQVSVIRKYLDYDDTPEQRQSTVNGLFASVMSLPAVQDVPDAWQQDARSELQDLAQGIQRDGSLGLHF